MLRTKELTKQEMVIVGKKFSSVIIQAPIMYS